MTEQRTPATEHQTMNTIIHAAFRRDLARLDRALATFTPGSRVRADQITDTWDNFSFQLRHHHEDEEMIFWPALRQLGAPDDLAGELEEEHEKMLAAVEHAEGSMAAFHVDPTVDRTRAAHNALTALSDVLLAHLAHEERDMEPISAANHKSPQIKHAQRVVQKAHKGNTGTLFAWLSDDADADVKAGLRREIPAPVLFLIRTIGGRDYNRRIASIWS